MCLGAIVVGDKGQVRTDASSVEVGGEEAVYAVDTNHVRSGERACLGRAKGMGGKGRGGRTPPPMPQPPCMEAAASPNDSAPPTRSQHPPNARTPPPPPGRSHLNGGDLESVSSRPALLIAGAAAARAAPAERARRDAALLEPLMAALRGGGSVLLPCDTAGRVLELLLLLDDHWGENKWVQLIFRPSKHIHAHGACTLTVYPCLPCSHANPRHTHAAHTHTHTPTPRPPNSLRDTYPLVFLSTVGPSTFDFAQASLEWMADGVTRAFEAGRGNPLKLRCAPARRAPPRAPHPSRPPGRGALSLGAPATASFAGPQARLLPAYP